MQVDSAETDIRSGVGINTKRGSYETHTNKLVEGVPSPLPRCLSVCRGNTREGAESVEAHHDSADALPREADTVRAGLGQIGTF